MAVIRIAVLGALTGLGVFTTSLAEPTCSPDGLDSGPLINTTVPGIEFHVNFLSPGTPTAYPSTLWVPLTWPIRVWSALPEVYLRLTDELGVREPYSYNLPEYRVYFDNYTTSKTANAYAGCVKIQVTAITNYTSYESTRRLVTHEMYHTVQRSYFCDINSAKCGNDSNSIGGSFGSWVSEGQCGFFEDRLYEEADKSGSGFNRRAVNMLASPTSAVFDVDYNTALFWSYLGEQAGFIRTEPEIGIDLVEDFWEQVVANDTLSESSSILSLEQVLAARGYDLYDLFFDYAICNIARELDASSLPNPGRYYYRDEKSPGGGYTGNVSYNGNVALVATNNSYPLVVAQSVDHMAADYCRITGNPLPECQVVGALVYVTGGYPLGVGLIGSLAGTSPPKAEFFYRQEGLMFGRTFLSASTSNISRLDLVAAAPHGDASYIAYFGAGDFNLQLFRPDFAHPALAGPAHDPGRIQVRVKVPGPTELAPYGQTNLSVMGLAAEDFEVMIGTAPAKVLAADYLGSEYMLAVQAPTQAVNNSSYNLTVSICTKQATQNLSVFYGDVQLDHVIAIDQSGSMAESGDGVTKAEAAKRAAKLYIDTISDGDGLAVVSFSGNASECDDDAIAMGTNRMLSANFLTRVLFKYGIDQLVTSNMTSIGDGLVKARALLATATNRPALLTNQTVVLLSDGIENEQLFWSRTNNVCGQPALRSTFPGNGIRVNAIAFGPGADQVVMQDIGLQTGGDYSYVEVPAAGALRRGIGASSGSGGPVLTMNNALNDAYLRSYEKASGMERVRDGVINLAASESTELHIDVIDDDLAKGRFFVAWDGTGMDPDVSVRDPSGAVFAGSGARADDYHVVYPFNAALTSGTYRIVVTNGASAGQLIYGLLADSAKDLRIDLSMVQFRTTNTLTRGEYEQGVPVSVRATITDRDGIVTNAMVDLRVTMPDGGAPCGPLRLYDDGAHDDDAPNDGLYGARFTRTMMAASAFGAGDDLDAPGPSPKAQRGTYQVEVTATGLANNGDQFVRSAVGAFTVFKPQEGGDSDGDGLPDAWERHYRTNPMSPDAMFDSDSDGLNNLAEFQEGTHPKSDDTDGGGESDGSEVAAGRCPLNPDDDALPAPLGVTVLRDPGCEGDAIMVPYGNILQFPDRAVYSAMQIYRSMSRNGPFTNQIATVNLVGTNVVSYVDAGLVEGVTYYYRMRAQGATGALSAWSRVVAGTPYADPVPPHGEIAINNHASATDTNAVLIDVVFSGGASHVRLSQNSITGSEPLIAITTNRIPFALMWPPGDPGEAIVFAQFVKPSGLAGPMANDTIRIDRFGDADFDGTNNVNDADNDNDGLSDDDEVNIYRTDPFVADTDLDGVSDAREVAEGTSPFIDDTDSDGLSDSEELDTYGTDPGRVDSAEDGVSDAWKVKFGFDPKAPLNLLNDSDGDGVTDYDEWLTGTNPTNASSHFAAIMAGQQGPDLRIRFPTLRGRMYDVQTSTNIVNPNSWRTRTTITAQVYSAEALIPAPTNNVPLNYRVRFRIGGSSDPGGDGI